MMVDAEWIRAVLVATYVVLLAAAMVVLGKRSKRKAKPLSSRTADETLARVAPFDRVVVTWRYRDRDGEVVFVAAGQPLPSGCTIVFASSGEGHWLQNATELASEELVRWRVGQRAHLRVVQGGK